MEGSGNSQNHGFVTIATDAQVPKSRLHTVN